MFPLDQPVAIFLLVLLIILLGPVVFRPLKIPSVVGMIIAGIIVGPYGFNLLERDASFRIFGEVGILYIMFTAAVEIDMFHLKQQFRRGIIYGLLSFAIPLAAGILGARYLFSTSWDTALLIASMYASHTLVTYPTVSRFGLQNTRGAVIAVCGTIVAVMLALLCLAAVVSARDAGGFSLMMLGRLFLWMAVYALAVGWTFPFITRRFFRTTDDSVAQFIFVLALVFFASLLAKLIGLEAILGAFYAGLVLNRMIPGRSPLMKNIRFVGDAIFIPYFLIGVGMLINVGVVVEGWGVIYVAAVMTLSALCSKWVAAWAAQKAFRLDENERRLMFGLSGGKAAATIAAVMIGYKYGMINEDIMNGSVMMILFCCLVASVATENAAKRIRMQLTENDLSHDELGHREYARQIISVANPVTSEELMRMAMFMRDRSNPNEATALFVRTDTDRRRQAMGRMALTAATAVGEAMDVKVDAVERIDLNIVSGICNVAEERHATEIMIGFHRKSNMVDSFFGALTESLLAASMKMVMMSRCFIPVDTVTRIFVLVPEKAEYETGFHLWVTRLSMLAANIEARIAFVGHQTSIDFIASVIEDDRIEVDHRFMTIESPDDIIILAGQIDDNDLLVVVSARKGSISFSPDLESLPGFLNRHFSRQNLLVVYPKQF